MFEPIRSVPADTIAGGRPAASASSFCTAETIESVDGRGPPDAAGAAPSSLPQATGVDSTSAVTASLRISPAPPRSSGEKLLLLVEGVHNELKNAGESLGGLVRWTGQQGSKSS